MNAKNQLIGVFVKGYIWRPSSCDLMCDNTSEIG